jgi:hypothetical protein
MGSKIELGNFAAFLPPADEMASTRFQKLARFFRISGIM